jgi:two-component system, NtrC family, response regulator AtoC
VRWDGTRALGALTPTSRRPSAHLQIFGDAQRACYDFLDVTEVLSAARTSRHGAPPKGGRILLLGPDDEQRRSLHLMLDHRGYEVAALSELDAAVRFLAERTCRAVIAPAELAGSVASSRGSPQLHPPVIAVVRSRELELSLAALDAGAADVVGLPLDEAALELALRRVETLPREPATRPSGGATSTLVGDSPAMAAVRATIARVAAHRTTVLILGESGTGKELVARSIHRASPRAERRFVAINCAALPAPLLESELFGHRRGAFTDAIRDKVGLFEEADGGTLFLDEVGELPLALQAKLLRALQESEIRRVGDNAAISVDVRLIAATLRDLSADVADGRFREDLFYRLAVVPVTVPPLRERRRDIAALAAHFLAVHNQRHHRDVSLAASALSVLERHTWPGNVRELENVIERALVLCDRPEVDAAFVESMLPLRAMTPSSFDPTELSIKKATRNLEEDLIRRALEATHGNRTTASRLLEISHRALLYKIKEYGIR